MRRITFALTFLLLLTFVGNATFGQAPAAPAKPKTYYQKSDEFLAALIANGYFDEAELYLKEAPTNPLIDPAWKKALDLYHAKAMLKAAMDTNDGVQKLKYVREAQEKLNAFIEKFKNDPTKAAQIADCRLELVNVFKIRGRYFAQQARLENKPMPVRKTALKEVQTLYAAGAEQYKSYRNFAIKTLVAMMKLPPAELKAKKKQIEELQMKIIMSFVFRNELLFQLAMAYKPGDYLPEEEYTDEDKKLYRKCLSDAAEQNIFLYKNYPGTGASAYGLSDAFNCYAELAEVGTDEQKIKAIGKAGESESNYEAIYIGGEYQPAFAAPTSKYMLGYMRYQKVLEANRELVEKTLKADAALPPKKSQDKKLRDVTLPENCYRAALDKIADWAEKSNPGDLLTFDGLKVQLEAFEFGLKWFDSGDISTAKLKAAKPYKDIKKLLETREKDIARKGKSTIKITDANYLKYEMKKYFDFFRDESKEVAFLTKAKEILKKNEEFARFLGISTTGEDEPKTPQEWHIRGYQKMKIAGDLSTKIRRLNEDGDAIPPGMEEDREKNYLGAISDLLRAQEMYGKNISTEELAKLRFVLANLYNSLGKFYEAAIIGEFVASRYPGTKYAIESATLSLICWNKVKRQCQKDVAELHKKYPKANLLNNPNFNGAVEHQRLLEMAEFLNKNQEIQKNPQAAGLRKFIITLRVQDKIDKGDIKEALAELAKAYPQGGVARNQLAYICARTQWNTIEDEILKYNSINRRVQRLERQLDRIDTDAIIPYRRLATDYFDERDQLKKAYAEMRGETVPATPTSSETTAPAAAPKAAPKAAPAAKPTASNRRPSDSMLADATAAKKVRNKALEDGMLHYNNVNRRVQKQQRQLEQIDSEVIASYDRLTTAYFDERDQLKKANSMLASTLTTKTSSLSVADSSKKKETPLSKLDFRPNSVYQGFAIGLGSGIRLNSDHMHRKLWTRTPQGAAPPTFGTSLLTELKMERSKLWKEINPQYTATKGMLELVVKEIYRSDPASVGPTADSPNAPYLGYIAFTLFNMANYYGGNPDIPVTKDQQSDLDRWLNDPNYGMFVLIEKGNPQMKSSRLRDYVANIAIERATRVFTKENNAKLNAALALLGRVEQQQRAEYEAKKAAAEQAGQPVPPKPIIREVKAVVYSIARKAMAEQVTLRDSYYAVSRENAAAVRAKKSEAELAALKEKMTNIGAQYGSARVCAVTLMKMMLKDEKLSYTKMDWLVRQFLTLGDDIGKPGVLTPEKEKFYKEAERANNILIKKLREGSYDAELKKLRDTTRNNTYTIAGLVPHLKARQATILGKLGDPEKALAILEELVSLNEKLYSVQINCLEILMGMAEAKKIAKGAPLFQKAYRGYTKKVAASGKTAVVWGWLGLMKKTSSQAIGGNPTMKDYYLKAMYNMAYCNMKAGDAEADPAKKKALYEKAVDKCLGIPIRSTALTEAYPVWFEKYRKLKEEIQAKMSK